MDSPVVLSTGSYKFYLLLRAFGLFPATYIDVAPSGDHFLRCRMTFSRLWQIYSYLLILALTCAHFYATFVYSGSASNNRPMVAIVLRSYSVFVNILAVVSVVSNSRHLHGSSRIAVIAERVDSSVAWLSERSPVAEVRMTLPAGMAVYIACAMGLDLATYIDFTHDTPAFINVVQVVLIASYSQLSLMNMLVVLFYFDHIRSLHTRLINVNRAFKKITTHLKRPHWVYEHLSPLMSVDAVGKAHRAAGADRGIDAELLVKIRSAIKSRLLLQDVAATIQESFGIALFTVVLFTGLSMIPCCYFVIYSSRLSGAYTMIAADTLRLLGETAKIVALSEISYRATTVATKSKVCGYSALALVKDRDARAELKLYLRKIEEKPIKLSGMVVFNIDRILIVNIFISVMSNLAILVQFDKH